MFIVLSMSSGKLELQSCKKESDILFETERVENSENMIIEVFTLASP